MIKNKENSKQKKISFFIIDYTFGGGVERVTADLITLFNTQGNEVNELVSLYAHKSNPVINYEKDLKIRILNPKSKKYFYNVFLNYFKTVAPDIFIFQGDNMTISLAILKAAKKAGVKAIPQYHGSVYAYLKKYATAEKKNYIKKIWSKIVYPFKINKIKQFIKLSENGIVCVSYGIKAELEVLLGEKNTQRIITIHNPIFLSDTIEVTSKDKIVSFVSRLESKHKNAFLVIKAWRIISKKHPDWSLHIYGTGSLEEKMKDYCVNNGIKNVIFNGFVTNLSNRLQKSTICVSTSNCEGFSMAIAEAIITKNAIASTNSDGGIKDMLKHNETALISTKNNDIELANNIEKLILDKELREKLSTNALINLNNIISVSIFDKWKNALR